MSDIQEINKNREACQIFAKWWASKYGSEKDDVARQAVATRLVLERRLGQVLPSRLIRDETGKFSESIPKEIKGNVSSAAQTLASTPKSWFKKLVDGILDKSRRCTIREIYLEAKRVALGNNGHEVIEETNIILGDFREAGSNIQNDSVALILTDPPYDRSSLELYGQAAELASRVLMPGGSFLAYAPNYALPEVLSSCQGHLRYWWTLAIFHSSDHALMQEYGIRVAYKPVVWFTKGGRFNKQQIISDVITNAGMEKTEHEWQQGVNEAKTLIRALTVEGDLVCDPMCGSGTTLVAAQQCGRQYMGIEVKPETAALARKRLGEILPTEFCDPDE